jgi:lipopolysaccharide export system permease protein
MTLWLAPVSLRNMQQMQHLLKSEFSTIAFREGVFNRFGSDITVFVRQRGSDGELGGLVIHDKRDENKNPVTVTAGRGTLSMGDNTIRLTVFDGSRQDYNPRTRTLNRLDFERYTVDLPLAGNAGTRWREPSERTFIELLSPDKNVARDMENLKEFRIEAHRRVISPLLALSLTLLVLPFLLLGPHQRRGMTRRIVAATCAIIILQAFYIGAFNFARKVEIIGLIGMYACVFAPVIGGALVLSPFFDQWRQRMLYRKMEGHPQP